jgi:recombination protein RecT
MNTAVATSSVHPLERLRSMLEQRAPELRRALPSHIPVERFNRVVLTAAQTNPELVAVDRQTLWLACMRAAQDGLLPDGREGVILPYKDNNSRSPTCGKIIAQWQPMIGGLLKRFRNSGQFKSIAAGIVREGEPFDYWIDEQGEHMRHVPGDAIARPVKAYAVAVTKDGGSMIRVMSVAEVNKRRAVSRAKDGPMWREWWDEAAMKTVLRNLSKRLPSSSDLDELMRRDDDEEAFEGGRQVVAPAPAPAITEAVDEPATVDVTPEPAPASPPSEQEPEHDAASEPEQNLVDAQPTPDPEIERAFAEGVQACKNNQARRAVPGPYREPQASHLAKAWWNGWDSAEQRS